MRFRIAQGDLYKALRAQLLRPGVPVGETAEYPRVEIHSFIESAPTDKDGLLHNLSCVVESMSTRSYGEAVEMNEVNIDLLLKGNWHAIGNEWTIISVSPDQLTELTETLDTQEILYRQLQRINILIWQN